ncbi:MAG TPA: hypothetical protein VFO73_13070 [Candidatus Limnocylindrales bacterium]|nr:hypothetical protein [Candidatus Limnocylindrales bacterium]
MPLVIGLALLGAGSVVGAVPEVADALLRGPILVRAALVGVVSVVGVWLLTVAVARIAGEDRDSDHQQGFAETIRGIRLVFLAVAAFAAASAFLVGHVLPLIVGLIIAGVDVAETALLLLVAGTASRDESPD